jgi:hypothetical protein
MNCPDCGSPVEKQAQFCPKCYARIEPPSLWQKFLSLFQSSGEPRRPLLTIKKTVTIKTNKDGERHEYNSLDQVPPEIRSEIEKLEAEAEKAAFSASSSSEGASHKFVIKKTASLFRVKDAYGTERVYHSLEEMPPEIRAKFEKARDRLQE